MKFRIAILIAVLPITLQVLSARQASKATWDGMYSEAQAKRGEALYTENCLACHGKDLGGGDRAPAAGGPAFIARWQNKPVHELFEYVQTKMPYNSPGGLSRAQNADIIGFMLRQSKVP